MKTIVIYKSKYGSTKAYATWIAEALGCEVCETKSVKVDELLTYDSIVCGGGLYAEIIAGANLITKNIEKLKDKKIAIFTTGITPPDCRKYYDGEVIEKNFKQGVPENIKLFNFPGKMILEELSTPHRLAIKALKKIMSGKENPTDMEKLLVELCDTYGDFTDKNAITPLIEYITENN